MPWMSTRSPVLWESYQRRQLLGMKIQSWIARLKDVLSLVRLSNLLVDVRISWYQLFEPGAASGKVLLGATQARRKVPHFQLCIFQGQSRSQALSVGLCTRRE
jgi:hypothetical protein